MAAKADRHEAHDRYGTDGYGRLDRGLHPGIRVAAVFGAVAAGATAAPALAVALPLRALWGPQPGRGPTWFAAVPAAAAAVAWAVVAAADGRAPEGGPTELLMAGIPPGEVFRGALGASFGYVDAIVRSLRDTRGADAFAAWGGWQPFLAAYLHDVWRGGLLVGAPAAALWAWWDGLRVRRHAEVPLDPQEQHAEAPTFPAAVHTKAAAGAVEHEAPGRFGLPALTRRVPGHPPAGISVGWTADGRPIGLEDATMNRGALVSGTNGSGKTNLLELLLFDAATRGRPALLVDFKGSEGLIARVERLGGIVWAFDRPSPRWNPTQGNASEVAAKVTAVEGTQTGNQWNTVTAGYVQLAVRAMLEAEIATDPATIAALLNPPELARFLGAQEATGRLTPQRAAALRRELALATDKEAGFDVRPLGGVASRMRGVLHGAAADWLGQPEPGEPYLDVPEAVKAGRVVLFSVNANRYGLPARRLGAWVLAEAMRVSASLGSAWGAVNRCLLLVDEFSSLEEYGGAISKVLAVARENGVATFLFTQSLSRLKTELGEGGAGTVADALGNCNLKAVFRHPEPTDAKEWSTRLGDFDRTEYARAVDPETGEATGNARPKRAAVPYAAPRVLATLPDYHAFVVRPGDTRPALVRLARAAPPAAREAAPLPVWDEVVVRWPGTSEAGDAAKETPEAPAARAAPRELGREPAQGAIPGPIPDPLTGMIDLAGGPRDEPVNVA
jgi:TraM recognition site of TraD and TraG/Type IV secretion-system coupling protein DNA-binding domain